MNKKTIAYILIGAGVLGLVYFLFIKKKGSLNTGTIVGSDPRGEWAAADEAGYKRIRDAFKAEAHWLDEIALNEYESAPSQESNSIKGVKSKTGSFLQAVAGSAPNYSGIYPSVPWDTTKPSLWPYASLQAAGRIWEDLKRSYGGM